MNSVYADIYLEVNHELDVTLHNEFWIVFALVNSVNSNECQPILKTCDRLHTIQAHMPTFQFSFNLQSCNSVDTGDNSHRSLHATISTCPAFHTTLTPPEYLCKCFQGICASKVLSQLHIAKLHQELPN